MTEDESVREYRPEEPELPMPERYVTITLADGEVSKRHACGARRVKAVYGERKLSHELATVYTQPCFESRPGAKTKLVIAFHGKGEKAKPKGLLALQTTRGKLSPSRLELDGTKSQVTIEYTAPDESIRVSIRAFVDGFARGKIHLHLEE